MFHKEGSFTLPGGKKNQDTPLKKSDRRKLRERFASSFYYGFDNSEKLKQDMGVILDVIFLDLSSEILLRKIKTVGNGISRTVNFYLRTPSLSSDNSFEDSSGWPYHSIQPILIELLDHPYPYIESNTTKHNGYGSMKPLHVINWNLEKNPNTHPVLIPTLATLSVLPLTTFQQNCLPTITIPSSVSKYLCRGAHLMRAGMSSKYCTIPMQTECLKYTRGLVVLRVHGNPQPFASGFLSPDTTLENLRQNNEKKGIGVLIITCYGDDLWRDCMKGHNDTFCHLSSNTPSQHLKNESNYGNSGFVDGIIVNAIQENLISDKVDTGDIETMHSVLVDDNQSPDKTNEIPLESLKFDQEEMETLPIDHLKNTLSEDDDTAIQQLQTHNLLATINTTQSHDDILFEAFYTALLRLKKSDLPILVSTFYSKNMLSCIPPSMNFDLRKTSYKKVGVFLSEQANKGVLSLGGKDEKDPQAFILDVNKGHHLVFKSTRLANESLRDKDNLSEKKTMAIVKLYKIPSHFVTVLTIDEDAVSARYAKSEQRRGTGFLTGPECREILEQYLVSNNLIDTEDHEYILMDSALCEALFQKIMKRAIANRESFVYPTRFNRKDLHQIWLESLDDAFAIVSMPGSKILTMKRGDGAPKVLIEVVSRQGNKKFITRVRNLEEYWIDANEFCNDVSKRFGCSGTVDEECAGRESLKKGHVEVVFQGNLSQELRALLTGDKSLTIHGGAKDSAYCLPKSVIDIKLQKGVPKRTNN